MINENLIKNKIKSIKLGRKLILRNAFFLRRSSLICIFPDFDTKCNYYGLLYIDDFMEKMRFKKVYIFTTNVLFNKLVNVFIFHKNKIIVLDNKNMNCLLDYYCSMRNPTNYLCLSFKKPNGRQLDSLINYRNISYEEVFIRGLLNEDRTKIKNKYRPAYLGNDKEIINYLNKYGN